MVLTKMWIGGIDIRLCVTPGPRVAQVDIWISGHLRFNSVIVKQMPPSSFGLLDSSKRPNFSFWRWVSGLQTQGPTRLAQDLPVLQEEPKIWCCSHSQ